MSSYPEFQAFWGAVSFVTEIGSYVLFVILILFAAAYIYDIITRR